jgi:hypothetical protein
MKRTERMPLAEWADGHEISVSEAQRWCVLAGVKVSAKGMTPKQYTTLDNYVYDVTGKSCCAALR